MFSHLSLFVLAASFLSSTSAAPASTPTPTWYKPPADSSFLYAINGGVVPVNPVSSSKLAINASIYDVDLFDTSAETIAEYKKQGKKVVCYFSAGSYETNRPDRKAFDQSCLCNQGSKCKMDGWNEWCDIYPFTLNRQPVTTVLLTLVVFPNRWLDIHSRKCKLNVQKIMRARILLAAQKGCDAVDPDNVDSYTNSVPFKTTEKDQLSYNLFLATTAHANGLAVGLKNAGDLLQDYPDEVAGAFDFAVVEQCEQYSECDKYSPFIKLGKPAFDLEYSKKAPVCKPGWFSMRYSTLDLTYLNVAQTCPEY